MSNPSNGNSAARRNNSLNPARATPTTNSSITPNNTVADRAAYTAAETARLLGGISLRSLRRLEQRGLLRPSRALRTKLYLHSDLLAFLEESK